MLRTFGLENEEEANSREDFRSPSSSRIYWGRFSVHLPLPLVDPLSRVCTFD